MAASCFIELRAHISPSFQTSMMQKSWARLLNISLKGIFFAQNLTLLNVFRTCNNRLETWIWAATFDQSNVYACSDEISCKWELAAPKQSVYSRLVCCNLHNFHLGLGSFSRWSCLSHGGSNIEAAWACMDFNLASNQFHSKLDRVEYLCNSSAKIMSRLKSSVDKSIRIHLTR